MIMGIIYDVVNDILGGDAINCVVAKKCKKCFPFWLFILQWVKSSMMFATEGGRLADSITSCTVAKPSCKLCAASACSAAKQLCDPCCAAATNPLALETGMGLESARGWFGA